jgi:ABC-type tungstate transport system permease subunit
MKTKSLHQFKFKEDAEIEVITEFDADKDIIVKSEATIFKTGETVDVEIIIVHDHIYEVEFLNGNYASIPIELVSIIDI